MMQKQQVRYCVSVQDHQSGVPVCARVYRCGQCHLFFTAFPTSWLFTVEAKFETFAAMLASRERGATRVFFTR